MAVGVFVVGGSTGAATPPTSTHPATTQTTSRPIPAVDTASSAGLIQDATRTQLERALTDASSPLEQAHADLVIAQYILARQCAPSLTCVLVGRPSCPGEHVALAAEAVGFLDTAATHLREATESDSDAHREAEDRLDALRSFANLFVTLRARPLNGPSRRNLLDACSELAIYLDDPNSGIVESARLWQGVAYRLADRPKRATQVLRPSLTPPAHARIGFYMRLQRCLALGEAGQPVAGLSLCLKLGTRVRRWFRHEDKATRKQARLMTQWVRIRLLRMWAKQLRAGHREDRAATAESEANALVGDETFPPSAQRSLPLTETIAGLPDLPETASAPGEPAP